MKRNKLKPRTGRSIREFLRYYVLVLLQQREHAATEIIQAIKKESADNRDYRPSGQLLVGKEDVSKVLRQLKGRNLINWADKGWRLTRAGRSKLSHYEKQKEQDTDGKQKAARKLLGLMGSGKASQRVLDVGTGEGYLAFKVAEKGYRVLGIDSASFDYSKDSIKTARERAQSQGGQVEFLQRSVTGLRRMKGSFDYVVSTQAIHCMRDQSRCVKAVYRLLKPGGTFLCADFVVGLKGFLHHGWHSFLALSGEEWKTLLLECGFEQPCFYKVGDYLVVKARKPPF